MNATLTGTTTSLTGWGRTDPSTALVCVPSAIDQIQSAVAAASPGSLIARGLGRAYGNPAQCGGGTVLELTGLDAIQLDAATGCVTCGAGASLDAVLRVIVPAGFFLPVTPGTRNVTVGGAIAADVHGKNHHGEGSFANHVQWLKLLDGSGQLRQLSPSDPATALAFWATAGGMGLTGVIVEACFRLIPISSSLISVDTTRFRDLDALMAAMVEADARYRYSVAWVDSLNPAGRGVLTCGEHASREQVEGSGVDPLHYDPKALAGAPSLLPGGLLNTWTVRAFNEAWYRKAPKQREGELQAISPYFHPLDGVSNWNRIYGPAGFLQYQFAVPDAAAHLVGTSLEALRRIGAPSFLTVLKRFGPGNPGPLSFPMPGWTLAADVSAAVPGLFELLAQLDEQVAAAGGRLYLAKDSRQSATMLERSYPRLHEWRQQRALLDPRGVFSSDLARRVKL
ncbi:FAD-binding oxidoreductase [Synechococcus sp. CB0101]|uniref:FAD-binding oxidoreductase n=1 Tax=Synechococcus sp. CB0101 TaxID=232348 RepID=UPI0002001C13|nr:FAD-binding oxidoreductase [Synechococcus sp. CB0101]QCH15007.1 FAD-binding oxidoreductase [Synechococcus sp. CB0101]